MSFSESAGPFFKPGHLFPTSSLLEPHLNYCNFIFCSTQLEKWQILQKKLVGATSRLKVTPPSGPLFNNYKPLKLTDCNTLF